MPFFQRGNIRMHYEVHEGIVDRVCAALLDTLATPA